LKFIRKYTILNCKFQLEEAFIVFRMWGKLIKDNHLKMDTVVENNDLSLNRTKKVFDALDEMCYKFDLSKPIWLENNIEEFKRISKTRFRSDNFIDSFPYDYLEIHVIEEDI